MIPSDILRIFVNTGNLISCKEFNKRATQSPTEEMYESVKWVLHSCVESNSCNRDDSETLRCINIPSAGKVDNEDRVNLKLTVKVFLQNYEVCSLKEAISEVLDCLGVTFIDSVVLSLPSSPCATLQLMQPVWRVLEQFVTDAVIVTIGVSDLDTGQLFELYNWAKIKPSVNQVNLESCCVMPPEMTVFAKENDIQLLTHNDPKDVLPKHFQKSMLERVSSTPDDWGTTWVVRYSVVVKCRGIIQNKGYLLSTLKKPHAVNGPC